MYVTVTLQLLVVMWQGTWLLLVHNFLHIRYRFCNLNNGRVELLGRLNENSGIKGKFRWPQLTVRLLVMGMLAFAWMLWLLWQRAVSQFVICAIYCDWMLSDRLVQVVVDVHVRHTESQNEALCLEILSMMRRCLTQQADIRLLLYEARTACSSL